MNLPPDPGLVRSCGRPNGWPTPRDQADRLDVAFDLGRQGQGRALSLPSPSPIRCRRSKRISAAVKAAMAEAPPPARQPGGCGRCGKPAQTSEHLGPPPIVDRISSVSRMAGIKIKSRSAPASPVRVGKARRGKALARPALVVSAVGRDSPPGTARHCNCWMPATTQPPLPSRGLARCQTSLKASAAASRDSRIKPSKRTLATYCLPSRQPR